MFTVIPSVVGGDALTSALWNGLADSVNKGVVRPIAETTLAGSAASISFTAIAADWSHLALAVHARSTGAATYLLCRLNGDTGANYGYDNVYGGAGAAAVGHAASGATAMRAGFVAGSAAPAGAFALSEFMLSHYAQASSRKPLSGTAFLPANYAGVFGGEWQAAAAIVTQITLLPEAGNFDIGTRATLYGMGGI